MRNKILFCAVLLTFLLPNLVQALTVQDILNSQGRVLGASTNVSFDASMTGGNGESGHSQQASSVTSISSTGMTVGASATCLVATLVLNNYSGNAIGTSMAMAWNGTPMTEEANAIQSVSGDDWLAYIFVLPNPVAGNKTLSASWDSQATSDAYMSAISFKGTDTTTCVKASDNTTSVNTTSITIPSDASGATVAASIKDSGDPTMNQTPFWADSPFNPGGGGSYAIGGTSNIHTFTYSGGTTQVNVGVHVIAGGGGTSDTTPPSTPNNLTATTISSSAVNLSWTASTDNVGVTGYTIYRGGVQVGTSNSNSYSDTGLTASTQYTYTVDAYDAAGNHSSQSSSASATTQALSVDTTPPSTPTNLTATAVSSSSINLSWTASTDNVGVTGYKIYRNSTQIATSATNSYSDSGLTASTQYTYTVSAYDAAGNNSSQSTSASATTQAVSSTPCLVVTPAGSGNKSGSDWNNAMAGLSATLTRGKVYYLGDGTYPSYTFSTPASGSTLIIVRKAQSYDHCTDTGWNTVSMGSSQAVFTRSFAIQTSYFVLDGNGTQTASGCGGAPGSSVAGAPPLPSDCGIKIDKSACSGGSDACDDALFVGNASTGVPAGYYTVQYVEIIGNGNDDSDRYEIFAPFGSVGTSTFKHIYGHYAGCVYFQDGGDSRTVSNSYFWGTEPNGAQGSDPCHGQYAFYSGSDSNSVEYDNVYRDITGTAIYTFANSSTIHNNWQYYNNVYFQSSPASSWSPYLANGIIACINTGTICTNFVFAQNTIIGISGLGGIDNENSGGSYTVQNNLWYNSVTPGFLPESGANFSQNHNSCLNSGTCPAGTANVTDVNAPNPFVNWQSGNFNLASENADWDNRIPLGAPYATDPNGTVRTTDVGVYQYVNSTSSPDTTPPAPPTGVSVN